MRNQKGITLIALVITIIVLLILAGVSIAMLTGENGILTKSRTAVTETSEAEKLEAVKLALAEIVANDLSDSTTLNEINKANIETIITRDNSNITVADLAITDGEDEGDPVTFTTGTKNYSINTETAKITEVPAANTP